MKVIIAGGRDFDDIELFIKTLFDDQPFDIGEVVSGCASGADTLAINFARVCEIPLKRFPAEWDKYGRAAAGIIRNRKMADYADALVAFWDGKSPGTRNMIDTAKELGLEVHVCLYHSSTNLLMRELR